MLLYAVWQIQAEIEEFQQLKLSYDGLYNDIKGF